MKGALLLKTGLCPPGWVCALLVLLASDAGAQTNGVLREVYYNINGSVVDDLTNAATFPDNPDEMYTESSFEAPSNFADNYGQRMRAVLIPPATGSYIFYISSDDNSTLYLSTDETPARKTAIASVTSWTESRAFTTYVSQQSSAISLVKGSRYYIEALQKEGSGGDNLAVTWKKPGDADVANGNAPIPGANMVPYGLGPPTITVQPVSTNVIEGGAARFKIQLIQNLGARYQWMRNGVNIPGATNSSCGIYPVAVGDSGAKFSCYIVNGFGSASSLAATLTVTPDTVRPALASASCPGDPALVTVLFTKLLEPASATNPANYALDNGASVLSAAFGTDAQMILLKVTPLVTQTDYVLTVNNIRDLAASPNTIAANSQKVFSLSVAPLSITLVTPQPEPSGPSTRHGPMVISEIMYHPARQADGKNLQYIELFNSQPYFEDISGFRVDGDVQFTFPTNTLMPGKSYLVIAASPDDFQAYYGVATRLFGPFANALSKQSGDLKLVNREGGTLFEVAYSDQPPWPVAADGAGHSLVLARPSLGEKNPKAWAASSRMGGSPGMADSTTANPFNSIFINEFQAHSRSPDRDFIELYNYSAGDVDVSGCVLTDDPEANLFVLPAGSMIPARGFLSFDETQMGFKLSADGGAIYLIDTNMQRVVDAVRFGPQAAGVSTGRFPDGADSFAPLLGKTPGAPNARPATPALVINEIMYAPISGDKRDQYVELHNPGATSVDVSGWGLSDAVSYTVPPGTVVPANGYLVIAKDTARLISGHAALNSENTIGNFSGSLSGRGERIALTMPEAVVSRNSAGRETTNDNAVVVDEVAYGVGGRWGQWSHGGGSSLELIDARANRRLAANWADSDETAKSGWVTIENTGVLDNGNGDADSLQIVMLGAGECLVDNVEASVSGGTNLVANSTFETGLDGWVAQGNHEDSSQANEGYNSAHSLHVRATDRGDTGANRIRVPLASSLTAGQTVTLRAKVRWLAGCPEILIRLHGSWLEATGNMLTAQNQGTPGQPNSRARSNAGPAISNVKHTPVLPASGQAVTVTASVDDPDGLAVVMLKYCVDPATNVTIATMAYNGADVYSATIPAQAAGKIVAFHVQALDNAVVPLSTTFPNDAPARQCLIRWGDPEQSGDFGTYRVWMTQATFDRWSRREHLSNKPLDCTFVYGNSRVIYNIGGQYSGSPWHAPGYDSPTGNVCDYLLTFPEDDPLLGETDSTLQWPGNGGGDNSYQREQTAYWIAEQMGLPYCYRRSVNLFINGVRRAELYEDVQQPDGDMDDEFFPDGKDGDLHKIQNWYEFDDPAVTFTTVGATLSPYTTTGNMKKLAAYRCMFARRAVNGSANDYTNLFALVDAANYTGLGVYYRRQLESTIDVDNWLKTYAVEHIVGNSDSFAYGSGQNMYAYKPAGDTWKLMIWDIDFAFSSLAADSGPFDGIGRSNGFDLGEPAYTRRYYQILQDLAAGPLDATKSARIIDARYSAMTTAGRSVDNPSAIKDYISQRRANLLNVVAGVSATFGITLNKGRSFSTNRDTITITGSAPVDVRTITINGVVWPVTWTSVTNWSSTFALGAGTNILSIQGWNAQGVAVNNASNSITIRYTGTVDLPENSLVINEIMYRAAAENGEFIELVNKSSSTAFDMSGWRLDGAGFTFPGGTVFSPRTYLVIARDRIAFASAYGTSIPVAGEFNASLSPGETLRLIKPGNTPDADQIISQVFYDSTSPWPSAAASEGASLQLQDYTQDNNRAGNWNAISTNAVWIGTMPPRYTPGAINSLHATMPVIPKVWLNEIEPGNQNGLADHFGQRHAWVELYNSSPGTVSLKGFFLANNYTNYSQWEFPENATIPAYGFLVVWLDGNPNESTANEFHSSITVPERSGHIALSRVVNTTSQLVDYLNYSVPGVDFSCGKWPDGVPGQLRAFYYVTPGATNNPASQPLHVMINEWMAENSATLANPATGAYSDWFELYNPSDSTAELGGFFLGTSLADKTKFPIPDGWSIPPDGHLLVWADNGDEYNALANADLHVNFKLSKQGEAIGLFAPDGTIIDYIAFGVQQQDVSEGRYPDGGSWISALTQATPREANWTQLPNTAPVIAPVTNVTVFAGQLVLVPFEAVDTNVPAQVLTWTLDTGSPSDAAINAATGLFSWRPANAGDYTVFARVIDDGVPPLSAIHAMNIHVLPLPRMLGVSSISNGVCSIQLSSVAGKRYRLEFKNSLSEAQWQPMPDILTGVGDTLSLNLAITSDRERYFRVSVVE